MKVEEKHFGCYDGADVTEYTLTNDSGMTVSCLNFGCVITKILVPDREGTMENVVLGFDNFEDYQKLSPYFGAVCGRVAGRIKGASFELDGNKYVLVQNEAPNHLHGGVKGFDSVIWETKKVEAENAAGLTFFYHSPDGEEGYPGNLETTVTYLLTNDNELKVTYEARTDKKTLVNLTNHSYFNLSGNIKRDCSEHILQLDSDRFLELASDLMPTGEMPASVNTPFDFTAGRKLKDGMESSYPQNVLVGKGYDHPLVFSEEGENRIVLSEEESGRVLEITTDQPCVVLYTSNMLDGDFEISGVKARNYLGVCLETQGLPDAIHHPNFPSVTLNPKDVYRTATTYRFLTKTLGD
ncbi:aldose epimerase family protein [Neobacillus cucumis]|uniref:Aldose 1-epimerase n=1 Tax=Neobacillus cucumis TaxID=1740721 RepID=A0A2N5HJH2_9BACI|nr:aldose epimerase family protein [Neobacillus cucumis]PLS05676.1 galactose-1-epimerase [Neobacillus cucumis]